MDYNKITIVINTFKSGDIIENCLDSINPAIKVINIENSNNINFKKKLENKYSNVECFLVGENLGYAKGNNLGLSKVKSEFALILNPDTKLEKNTVDNFLDVTNKITDFAIVGPAKQNEFTSTDDNLEKENIFQVDSLKGFAMFLNLKEFNEIGYFDENFFIYLEEIDLCKRVKEKRKNIYLVKNIKVQHLGGKSHNESLDFEMELSRNWHWMWSTFYFNRKYKGFIFALLLIIPKLISSILKFLFFTTIQKQKKKQIYLQRFSGLINSILGKRSWYRPKI